MQRITGSHHGTILDQALKDAASELPPPHADDDDVKLYQALHDTCSAINKGEAEEAVAGREELRRLLERRRGGMTQTRTRAQGSASGNLAIVDEALSRVRPRRLHTRNGVLSPNTNHSGAYARELRRGSKITDALGDVGKHVPGRTALGPFMEPPSAILFHRADLIPDQPPDTAQIMLPCQTAGNSEITWHSLTLRLHAAIVYTAVPAHYRLYERVGNDSAWLVRDGLDSAEIRQGRGRIKQRTRVPHSQWSALSYVVELDTIVPGPTVRISTAAEPDNRNEDPPNDDSNDAPANTKEDIPPGIGASEAGTRPDQEGVTDSRDGEGCGGVGADGGDGARGTKRGTPRGGSPERAREIRRRHRRTPRREHAPILERGEGSTMTTAQRERDGGDRTRSKTRRCEAGEGAPPEKRQCMQRRRTTMDCAPQSGCTAGHMRLNRKRKRTTSPVSKRQRASTPITKGVTDAVTDASRVILPEPALRPRSRPLPFRDKHAMRVSLRHARTIHHGRSNTAPRVATTRIAPPPS